MNTKLIFDKYDAKISALQKQISIEREQRRDEIRTRLAEIGLSGLVKRKSNGHIGKLEVNSKNSYYTGVSTIQFFPLTKKGEISLRSEYFYYKDVEEEFEPYKEGEKR